MLNFASHELNDWESAGNFYEFAPVGAAHTFDSKPGAVKLFADKIGVPSYAAPATTARPRLIEQLNKSARQFAATLIAGRAGTGKTILATDFARQSRRQTAWYRVENADLDWTVFSSYLLGSLRRCCPNFDQTAFRRGDASVSEAAETLAAQFNCAADEEPFLIVLDDVHSVFDAEWFAEFFQNFVPLLAPDVHLLMVARTLPPLQIWRLRSKQVLGVLDERMLTFNLEETQRFFQNYKLSAIAARSAHRRTFGRIAKLAEIAAKKSFA